VSEDGAATAAMNQTLRQTNVQLAELVKAIQEGNRLRAIELGLAPNVVSLTNQKASA
jgi:hypothetical protein